LALMESDQELSAVIDARSPGEFALDHLPNAANWPSLSDDERRQVGTQYKQISAFEARKQGAAMVARNIAAHLDRHMPGLPREWKPLVYCWRGGQRSGALALILSQIGFEVRVLQGGYRAFRQYVVSALDDAGAGLTFEVLCGKTGSGKSRLLQSLHLAGAQVLDLEGLACHRGSVLGALPHAPQPSQKRFETLLWHALKQFDVSRPVFVESESRLVGQLRLPQRLLERLRSGRCWRVDMPDSARVALLSEDYAHLAANPPLLCERLSSLRELRGTATVDGWCELAHAGRIAELVEQLLHVHYDPIYMRSMAKNFLGFDQATPIVLPTGAPADLRAAADGLIQATSPANARINPAGSQPA
jgi:tRNA 2-selenouridine synthase